MTLGVLAIAHNVHALLAPRHRQRALFGVLLPVRTESLDKLQDRGFGAVSLPEPWARMAPHGSASRVDTVTLRPLSVQTNEAVIPGVST